MAQTVPRVSQLLLFTIEDSLFCCPSGQVLTLIAPPSLTRIPFMPDFARGAFDYQGHTASVISLRHKLHFADSQDRGDGVILLSPMDQRIAGFWIDAVDEVVDVDQIKWLVMPEGFQDAVFSHAVQYEERTAFYLDLNLLWTHQDQNLVNLHELSGEQLQAVEELPAAEMDTNEPHAIEPEPMATNAVENIVDLPNSNEDNGQEAPTMATGESVADTAIEAESAYQDEEPAPLPAEEITETLDDHEPDYRVAASSVSVVEEYREAVTETPTSELHSVISEGLGDLEQEPRRRRYGLWLVVLLLLLLLPGGFFFYQQMDHRPKPINKPKAIIPPPASVEEEKITVDEETTIRIQKQPLVNPPPHIKQHVVVRGDTLWDISSRYLNNPWLYPELARRSEITNPDRIYPGDVVIIYRRPDNE